MAAMLALAITLFICRISTVSQPHSSIAVATLSMRRGWATFEFRYDRKSIFYHMKLAKNLISINWIVEKVRDRQGSGIGISRRLLRLFIPHRADSR